MASENERLIRWLLSNDTGLSSKAIACRMAGVRSTTYYETSYPLDADDFGRCYRLLQRIPEWRARIGEMAAVSSTWARFAAQWAKIEALYESDLKGLHHGYAPNTYRLIDQIVRGKRST